MEARQLIRRQTVIQVQCGGNLSKETVVQMERSVARQTGIHNEWNIWSEEVKRIKDDCQVCGLSTRLIVVPWEIGKFCMRNQELFIEHEHVCNIL